MRLRETYARRFVWCSVFDLGELQAEAHQLVWWHEAMCKHKSIAQTPSAALRAGKVISVKRHAVLLLIPKTCVWILSKRGIFASLLTGYPINNIALQIKKNEGSDIEARFRGVRWADDAWE